MELITYLIKANVAIILFYGFYRLFSVGDTFFRWRRFILLFILLFSLLYPFVEISKIYPVSTNSLVSELPLFTFNLDEVIVSAGATQTTDHNLFYGFHLVYFAGLIILSIRLFMELGGVLFTRLRSHKQMILNRILYVNRSISTPFSFFRFICVNPEKHSSAELEEIILHEETHARQLHSVDTLFCELVCIMFWFNPFIWLLRKDLRLNLEYLADRSVINSGCDSEHYQFHLLRLTYSKAIAITNNFNVSPLKQRILMMNKQQTQKLSLAKYLLFLPLVAGLLFFNCSKPEKTDKMDAMAVETEEIAPINTETIVDKEETEDVENIGVVEPEDEKKVYEMSEFMPSFPGGDKAFFEFLMENLKYPEASEKKGVEGTVTARFVVNKEGKVGNAEILKGVNKELNEEAKRVLALLPDFNPGMQDGKPVDVYFTVPVKFKLKK